MDKITVIIPVYNGEEYIRKAIDSVLNQTYKEHELIVVDDCSTDGTSDILQEYSGRIRVIRHDKNMGVGVARQTGIDAATGDYITFLDSDDYLSEDFLEMNLMLAKQHDSDVVYTSFAVYYPDQKVFMVIPSGDFIMSGEATPQLHFWAQKKFLTGKLFRTSLVRQIRFSPKRIGEDVQTLFFLTYLADKVRSSSYSGYVHTFRKGSLLADAPYFLCFCGSTMAELEIAEFLYGKQDWKLFRYVFGITYRNYLTIQEHVRKGVFSDDEISANHESWDFINNWFSTHDDYIQKLKEHE